MRLLERAAVLSASYLVQELCWNYMRRPSLLYSSYSASKAFTMWVMILDPASNSDSTPNSFGA